MNDHYQVLGVSQDASQEEISRRYRFLVRVYHPDRFQETAAKNEAEEEMKKINNAYSVLSSAQKRAEYDREIRPETSRRTEEDQATEADPMIDYLTGVGDKWLPLLGHLLTDKRISESLPILQSLYLLLLKEAYPGKNLDSIRHITDKFDKSVAILISLSLSLGSELHHSDLPRGYSLSTLEDLICSSVYSSVYETITIIQKRGAWSVEIEEILQRLLQVVLATSKLCQSIGHEFVEKKASPPSENANKSNQTEQRSTAGQTVGASPKSSPQTAKKPERLNYCQSCKRLTETKKVTFNQNIGMLIRRYHRTVEGYLCGECIEKYFWEFTGKTLILGWWGMISSIVTPFYLLGNLGQYWGTREIRRNCYGLGEIAQGWKVVSWFSLLGILVAIYVLVLAIRGPQLPAGYNTTANTNKNSAGNSAIPAPASTSVAQITPTSRPPYRSPSPTPQRCLEWSDITAADEGKNVCVNGIVRNAYWAEDRKIFYMTFGSNTNDFRLIVLEGYYYENVKGNCVMVEGEVKTYGSMPYIEVAEKLYQCE